MNICQIACEILATPASTAPVELVFSSRGEVIRGKRNRLTDNNLERETFLRRNEKCIKPWIRYIQVTNTNNSTYINGE